MVGRISRAYGFFFFNDTATTEIYTLSLHDALPISARPPDPGGHERDHAPDHQPGPDRKSTRLNSSHQLISYAAFCLKKKKARREEGKLLGKKSGCGKVDGPWRES